MTNLQKCHKCPLVHISAIITALIPPVLLASEILVCLRHPWRVAAAVAIHLGVDPTPNHHGLVGAHEMPSLSERLWLLLSEAKGLSFPSGL